MLKLIISIALFAAAIVLTVVSVARKSIGGRIHATAAGAAMCLIAAIGLHAFAIVPAGHTGVRVHLGNVSETVLASGLHWKTPVLDKIVNVNNKIQRADVQGETSTKDLQAIGANVSVNYNVSPGAAATLYRDVGGKVADTIIKPAIQEAIKSTFAMFTAEELITRRSEVSQLIQESLSDKLDSYGVKVHEMNILDMTFSEEYNAAIEAKQTAQQNALKAEQDLARIEVEAKQKVVEAQAEADANRIRSESITANILTSEFLNKWDGKLPSVVSDGSQLFQIPITGN